jgi:hypothetical protein
MALAVLTAECSLPFPLFASFKDRSGRSKEKALLKDSYSLLPDSSYKLSGLCLEPCNDDGSFVFGSFGVGSADADPACNAGGKGFEQWKAAAVEAASVASRNIVPVSASKAPLTVPVDLCWANCGSLQSVTGPPILLGSTIAKTDVGSTVCPSSYPLPEFPMCFCTPLIFFIEICLALKKF